MFFRIRPILKVSVFQNVFRGYQSEGGSLEKLLQSLNDLPVKQGYSAVFFDDKVQKLLEKVSRVELQKVFKPRPCQEELKPPVFKLLTTEELNEELRKAEVMAKKLLQIPPLIDVTEDKVEVIDSDTSLDGYDEHHSKHIFIDTSPHKDCLDRVVVVREANGVLRTANKSERRRANQIFFPFPGRKTEIPAMFEYSNLVEVIKRKEYEFILNRACAQFEPDDLAYHKVITLTYEAINFCKDFSMLHSTRHFGSLVFYLVTHQNIDNLLIDNLLNDRIDDCFSLVSLYLMVHPDCKTADASSSKTDMEILKDFIKFDSNEKIALSSNLDLYIKRQENQKELMDEIKEAHGL